MPRRRNIRRAGSFSIFKKVKFWLGCISLIAGIALLATGVGSVPGFALLLFGSAFMVHTISDYMAHKNHPLAFHVKCLAIILYIIASTLSLMAIAAAFGLTTNIAPAVVGSSAGGASSTIPYIPYFALGASALGAAIVGAFSFLKNLIFRHRVVEEPAAEEQVAAPAAAVAPVAVPAVEERAVPDPEELIQESAGEVPVIPVVAWSATMFATNSKYLRMNIDTATSVDEAASGQVVEEDYGDADAEDTPLIIRSRGPSPSPSSSSQ